MKIKKVWEILRKICELKRVEIEEDNGVNNIKRMLQPFQCRKEIKEGAILINECGSMQETDQILGLKYFAC